ncbi:MAG: tripartite tricarboxylate transporter substrate binding protein [Rhizobiales bacterium]|nr:tripartite tricarboxylate transporter substrate binding protein [Hyphomicrobiales bacterium]
MKIIQLLLKRALIAFLFCTVAEHSVRAETWPTRPIVIVFGFGAGGSADAITRRFAEFASKELGQPVVVENRPGAGGVVAAVGVSKAVADGYTIMMHASGPMILRPIIDPSIGYDSVKGFTPIVLVGESPNVILGGSKFSARSVQDMVGWAKKNPGLLTVGHPGLGTAGHLGALLLASRAGFTANYIAYRDNAQILPDIMGGQIDVASVAYAPQLKSANILAVMAPERVEFLPAVPSMREAGFSGVYASTWWALYGPPNLPPDIVARLNAIMNAFLRSDVARKQMALIGFQGLGGSSEQLSKMMADEKALWSKVIEDAKIKMNDPK